MTALLTVQDPVTGKLTPVTTVDNGDGTRKLQVDLGAALVTLTPSEIEIGHVVLKNNDTEDHADVGVDNHLNAVRRNLPNWGVQTLTSGVAPSTLPGPNVAVPDGMAVYIEADEGNVDDVQVGAVGESAAAGSSRAIAAGDPFPVAIFVDNLNKIEITAPTTDAQKVRFILEKA